MKKILAVLLVSIMCVMPFTSQAATPAETDGYKNYPYYLAAGIIGGAVLFNFITGGLEAVPFVASSSSLWEGPLAINRVLTALSIAAGALAVDWGYKNLEIKADGTPKIPTHH
ncbi:hypothetical protein TI05_00140 [Achromatium sp. WMS3]|nr:hypothetical protein TI05_00140 [Achromatium sp. WMS3]